MLYGRVFLPLLLLGTMLLVMGADKDTEALKARAFQLAEQKRYKEADVAINRYVERLRAQDHGGVTKFEYALGLSWAGKFYTDQRRYADAEAAYREALRVLDQLPPGDLNRDMAMPVIQVDLSSILVEQERYADAAGIYRKRLASFEKTLGTRRVFGDEQQYEFVKILGRLLFLDASKEPGLMEEAFRFAQLAGRSEAAMSLAQMAARNMKGDSNVAMLTRQLQDLSNEAEERKKVDDATWKRQPEEIDGHVQAENLRKWINVEVQARGVSKQLEREYAGRRIESSVAPLTIAQTQAYLAPNEAAILVLSTPRFKKIPEETFVWVVNKTRAQWVRSDLGYEGVRDLVGALRCGLNATSWDDAKVAAHCRAVLNASPERDSDKNVIVQSLPFDQARAHTLYRALFGQVGDLIRDKHLLLAMSGPLTQLPLQVLVTHLPNAERCGRRAPGDKGVPCFLDASSGAEVHWLARSHPITVLPAVFSLNALRFAARPSGASKAMIGFGNPLLEGDPRYSWDVAAAAEARTKKRCEGLSEQPVAVASRKIRAVVPASMRDGIANLAQLRAASPLPDTADELCAVGTSLKADRADVYLGENATEGNVKKLSASGELANYRIVHFATHGALAGEVEQTTEPGLILTPPTPQTSADDGYLSASEIALLRLDADWVVLSACNTAAGEARDAEALTGLANAFIYAGARALLVSHWPVNSAATVKLVTNAVDAIAMNEKIGRAEALRRSMLHLADSGNARERHPSLWAPFIVVGEGAAR